MSWPVIRIDVSRESSTLVMRVAGSLSGRDVVVLVDAVAGHGVPGRLDLSDVAFVDAEGAREVLDLEALGTALVGTQPFVALLLRTCRESARH